MKYRFWFTAIVLLIIVVLPQAAEEGERNEIFAKVRGIHLIIPFTGMSKEKLLERSLEYTPRDVIRDGLPHFGSLRDDWKGTPRKHKGLDIYLNNVNVLSMAKGTVVGKGWGKRSGWWIKIDHTGGVETVYVHLTTVYVKKHQKVRKGQRIARISGPAGNAVEPQLHLELKLDGSSVDPIPYFMEAADSNFKEKLEKALASIPDRIENRKTLVAEYLSKNKNDKNNSKPVKKKTYYSIRVGAFKDEANAKNYSKKFKKLGYQTVVYPVKTKKGKLFRVEVGEFNSKSRAEKDKEKFEKMEKHSFTVVMKTK